MDKISKEDIICAIKEIDSNPELRKGRASSTYDLLYNNVEYPPKLVISIANKFATGEKLNPNDFDGGIGTPAFKLLEGFGFEIQKKRDPIKLLIENYKKHIQSSKLKDEVYKWELINEFKGKPNTDAVDFYQEVKNLKFSNLIYHTSYSVLNDLTKLKPEELRDLFRNLFDESKDLTDRIIKFSADSLKIYRDLGRTLQHHQDERSIATYLTYHNNEKYTLYKSSFYKRYCQLLGINEAEKNKKYVHYLKLIDELIENYIKVDAELIGFVKSYIPKLYDGSNNKLLAQDILYTMLQKETNNEEVFEIIEEFVEQGKTTNLKTSSYPKTFNGLNLKVSFGQGVPARIPWIGLTKKPNTISKGIYPVFLYYKEFNKLILAYGISETEKSEFDWNKTENYKTINEWHLKEFNKNPDRYGTSFIKSVYDLNIALDKDLIEKDLKEIISEYNKLSFENNSNCNYWIFQGNPKIYNMQEALVSNSIKTWTVSSHKDKIKIGDKFILWQTGIDSGCYALGEVASEVKMMKEEDEEMKYYFSPTSKIENNRVQIIINHNVTDKPILWNKIKDEEVFKNFKGGNQGTNFSATKDEYEAMIKLIKNQKSIQYWIYAPGEKASKWDDFYNEEIMGLGWDEIGDLSKYNNRIEIRESLIKHYGGEGSKKNDVSALDDFVNKMKIGDIIIAKKGTTTYLGYGYVSSEYYYDENAIDYKSRRKVNWKKKGEWIADHKIAIKTLTDISTDSKYIENVSKLIGIEIKEEKMEINQILYGPPGTGKTYRLQKEYFDKFTINESSLSKEQFLENLVQDLSWWQVISVAVYDLKNAKVNDIHNHELVRAKEKISNSKTIHQTIWGQLQVHTLLDVRM